MMKKQLENAHAPLVYKQIDQIVHNIAKRNENLQFKKCKRFKNGQRTFFVNLPKILEQNE